jgi:hypothetical protein
LDNSTDILAVSANLTLKLLRVQSELTRRSIRRSAAASARIARYKTRN